EEIFAIHNDKNNVDSYLIIVINRNNTKTYQVSITKDDLLQNARILKKNNFNAFNKVKQLVDDIAKKPSRFIKKEALYDYQKKDKSKDLLALLDEVSKEEASSWSSFFWQR
ncbi:MAG: hypothetical protein WBQ73_02965, partial [Candidatus Babeliales bacterium]